MKNKFSKASVIGFSLIMLSVIIGQFFIFNDIMVHELGRKVFDALYPPLLICLFLTHISGIVLSIVGLVNAIRKKLRGIGFSIAGIVFFVIEAVVIILILGLLFIIATGGEMRAAEPISLATYETTVREPREPEFYENNENLIFLENNINEDMSLSEVIDVFEQMHDKMGDGDRTVFKSGSNTYSVYDYNAGVFVDAGFHYGFCLKRWFTAEDGERYQICVNVLYKADSESYKYRDEDMSIDVHGNVNEDFFDDIRNTDAYEYASSLEIERIDIYMGPQQ